MPDNKMTIAAVGVGAVGSILAGNLAEAGAEVIVADVPQRISQIKVKGLHVQWGEKRIQPKIGTVDSIRSLADARPDCIFIATKACILEAIMPEVAEAAGRGCLVMSVQNGIGTEDEIARYVPPENVARMVVNYAGGMDEEGIAHVAWFNPPNFFGPHTERDDARLSTLVDMANSVGLTSELVDPTTVKKRAFLKTVLNSALMPICAVLGLTMREAMEGKATRELATDLLREGIAVGARLGYDYGEGIIEKCLSYLDAGGDHHPSMSVDLWNKRPTEICFINAKILEIGSGFDDLDLEVNRVLVALLMTMEVRNGTRKPGDFPDYVIPAS
jgi:2-dehydropantoate 2-reductase